MRFRLLHRRLTVSAPRMTIKRHMPWPVRWLIAAVALGLCAALALWAFEFGRNLTGMGPSDRQELVALRQQVQTLTTQLQQLQNSGVPSSMAIAHQAEKDALQGMITKLQAENQALREEVGVIQELTNGVKSGTKP